MRFFFDNNLAPKLARGFHHFVAGAHEVAHLRERFTPETRDLDWMQELARETEWVILSGDLAIRRNPHQLAAWKVAGPPIFFLDAGWTNLAVWLQVQKLAKCFSAMIARAQQAKSGDAFVITVNGKITNA